MIVGLRIQPATLLEWVIHSGYRRGELLKDLIRMIVGSFRELHKVCEIHVKLTNTTSITIPYHLRPSLIYAECCIQGYAVETIIISEVLGG